jgi:hypothetical protein
MSHVSECIRPHAPLHSGPGVKGPKTFQFQDTSVEIFPRLPNGQSIRVVIIRWSVTCSHGSTFHVVRNCGKWSYRIDYAFSSKPKRMTKARFVREIKRMGGGEHA